MVSSRATGSNDAGTVRKTSWFSSRSAAVLPGIRAFQASRRCSRYAAEAATGETLVTSSAAVQGRIGCAAVDARRAKASSWPS